MDLLISRASTKNHVIKEFTALRVRALLNAWLAKILMGKNNPKSLVGSDTSGVDAKRLSGVQCIRVDRIIGTIRPTDEFDKHFRPLKPQSRDRWVNALLQLKVDGWQPIVVHKTGQGYYIAQGHYRVSVARSVGMKFIEAIVWDHSECGTPDGTCVSKQKVLRRSTQSLSTN